MASGAGKEPGVHMLDDGGKYFNILATDTITPGLRVQSGHFGMF